MYSQLSFEMFLYAAVVVAICCFRYSPESQQYLETSFPFDDFLTPVDREFDQPSNETNGLGSDDLTVKVDDLPGLTYDEWELGDLQTRCQELGINYTAKTRKTTLVKRLREHDGTLNFWQATV